MIKLTMAAEKAMKKLKDFNSVPTLSPAFPKHAYALAKATKDLLEALREKEKQDEGYFSQVRWHREDAIGAFDGHGHAISEEDLDTFIEECARHLENCLVERGNEFLSDVADDFIRAHGLVTELEE